MAAAADQRNAPERVPSTSSGSSVVSPRPQTKRGRTITASSAPRLSSSTTCSAIAFEREYGAFERSASGYGSSAWTSGWPCISTASV